MTIRLNHGLVYFTTVFLLFFSPVYLSSITPGGERPDTLAPAAHSIFDLINQQEVADITIVTELDSLLENRTSEDYRPATFNFEGKSRMKFSYDIKIRPRGKFRRQICDFPPLKLKFPKKQLEEAGLSPMNEVKLVTHCMGEKTMGQELVLREYLVYKMYNELTPNSLRVQLAKVTYRDSKDKNKKVTRWGFLIEDEEELAHRIDGSPCDCMGQPASAYNVPQEKIASLFQYMIGNTDWSMEMKRNVELVKMSDGKLVPVPYDFDFSAFVSAPYARPNSDVGQKSLRDRVFMGYSSSANELYATFSYFKSKKDALLDVVYYFEKIDSETREAMLVYLESFYKIIADEETAQKVLFPGM